MTTVPRQPSAPAAFPATFHVVAENAGPPRADSPPRYAVRPWGAPPQAPPVARAVVGWESCPTAPPGSAPRPVVEVRDGAGAPLCSVRPAAPAPGTLEAYQVYAADGTPLARITHRPGRLLPRPRRARWTVRAAAGGDAGGGEVRFVGRVGSSYAWACYVLLAPLWLLWRGVVFLSALFGDVDDGEGVGRPRRVRWRGGGRGTVLDRHGVSRPRYDLRRQGLDHRVACAQAVLVEWRRWWVVAAWRQSSPSRRPDGARTWWEAAVQWVANLFR